MSGKGLALALAVALLAGCSGLSPQLKPLTPPHRPLMAAGSGCTVPVTDTGAQMIADINTCLAASGSGTINSGTSNQLAYYSSSGATISGATASGDCTFSGGAFACTKTGGTPFAPSATRDTTNASNITTGTLGAGLLPGSGAVPGTYSAGSLTVDAAGRVIASNPSVQRGFCGPTNLGGVDTVTFSTSCGRNISTATTNETALTFNDSRPGCTTTNRCDETWDWCQDATGGHTLAIANANFKFLNNASALDYPTTASGAGANCQEYYVYFNGIDFIETGETGAFAGP